MRPVTGRLCITALVLGLAAVLTVAPGTRLVSGMHMRRFGMR